MVKSANAGLVALGVGTGPDGLEPGQGAAQAGARYGIDLAATAERRGFTGASGTAAVIDLPVLHGTGPQWRGLAPAIALIGVGEANPASYRQAGARLARLARGRGPVTAALGAKSPEHTRSLVEGYLLGAYQPERWGIGAGALGGPRDDAVPAPPTTPSRAHPASPVADQGAGQVGDLTLLGPHDRAAVQVGWITAQAVILARDLTNTPASLKTPAWLEEQARNGAKRRNSVLVNSLGPADLDKQGLKGILAVGAGAWVGPAADAARSPRLVTVTHVPAGVKNPPHLVIVGKGITFDTGGLDLKRTAGMVSMKTDMAGAAAGLATVLALSDLGADIKVSAVLPLAQNSVGAASYRPGDVIELYGGTTVEIGDTDAEGRVVLADALGWSAANLEPTCVVDIATLTGAQKVALGDGIGAVFANDEVLAARFAEAGVSAGEDWWRLPLADAYEPALATPNADVATIALEPVGGGAITAALFLRRFAAPDVPWLHLDIAGPARATTGTDVAPAGATGFGVRTLLRLAQRLV
jgi:leucyl aminopeptidase